MPVMSHAKQTETGRRAKRSRKAREALILSNRGLAYTIARRYMGYGVDLDDLYGEAMKALVVAADKFDPERGIFSVLASFYIRGSIRHLICKTGFGIARPERYADGVLIVSKIAAELESHAGERPTDEEIQTEYNKRYRQSMPLSVVHRYRKGFAPIVSLHETCGGEDGSELAEVIPDESAACPKAEAVRSDDAATLRAAVATLPLRERRVVERRFGLRAGRGETLSEIGDTYGVTRERIRQIEGKALRKLRTIMARKMRIVTEPEYVTDEHPKKSCPICGHIVINGDGCRHCLGT